MSLLAPFSLPGHWYRGILHVHSTASDGERSSDDVFAWYRSQGYHFVALTDHDVLSQARSIGPDLIALSGIEIEGIDPASGIYHLVGLGLDRPPDLEVWQVLPLQEAVDRMATVARLVVMAHPYWSGQKSTDLLPIERCSILEVYNGGCEVDDCKGYSNVHWDDLLAAGKSWWGLAVDDAHWRDGTKDAGLGWVWVKAPALTAADLLTALEQGHFYASAGPELLGVEIEGRRVHVRCSPAVAVDFVGNGPFCRRVSAAAGQTLTEAAHQLHSLQTYLRVAVCDVAGNWAWSNPVFVEPGD